MGQKKKNIFIWGASFLIAEGLKSLLNGTDLFSVAGISGSIEQPVDVMGEITPDVLVVDAAADGFQEVDFGTVKRTANPPAVLLIVDTITRNEFQKYSEAGIENIVLKNASAQELLNAVESAANRRKNYSSEILDIILGSIESKQKAEKINQLTPSEMEIVRLIAGGLTTKQIAARRNVSFHTVNTHRKNIFRKLEVSNASELTMKAIKAGWIDNIEYYI